MQQQECFIFSPPLLRDAVLQLSPGPDGFPFECKWTCCETLDTEVSRMRSQVVKV